MIYDQWGKQCSAGEELGPQQVLWVGHVGAVQCGVHEVLLLAEHGTPMTSRSQPRCLGRHSCGAELSEGIGVVDTIAQAEKDAMERPS
jgi:hypothetical protein